RRTGRREREESAEGERRKPERPDARPLGEEGVVVRILEAAHQETELLALQTQPLLRLLAHEVERAAGPEVARPRRSDPLSRAPPPHHTAIPSAARQRSRARVGTRSASPLSVPSALRRSAPRRESLPPAAPPLHSTIPARAQERGARTGSPDCSPARTSSRRWRRSAPTRARSSSCAPSR